MKNAEVMAYILRHAQPFLQGPGTQLKRILETFGITAQSGCGCDSMVARMNRWGVAGCREHLPEIVAHLEHEAKARGWRMPLLRGGATVLVRLALWKATRRSRG